MDRLRGVASHQGGVALAQKNNILELINMYLNPATPKNKY